MANTPPAGATARPESPENELNVEELLAEFPDAAELKILRQNERYPTKYDYLTTLPVDQFSQEGVKQEFGGGNYRVQIMAAGGKYRRQFQFSIDQRFKPAAVGSIQPGAASAEFGELRDMVGKLAATVGQLTTVMMQGGVHAPTARADADPLAMMDRVASIFSKLNPPSQGAGLPMLMDVLKQGMELGRSANPAGEGGGDSLGPMVTALQPLVGVIAKNAEIELERKRMRFAAPVPATPVALPSPAPTPVNTTPVPAWVAAVRPHLPMLMVLGSSNADVGHWAPSVLDMVPDAVFAELEGMAAADDFADVVLAALPEAREQEAWVRALLGEIRAILLAPEDGPGDEGNG